MATERKGVEGQAGRRRSVEAAPRGRRRPGPEQGEVGKALRSVYDDTVKESIPDDLLDLLGKLD